MSGIPYLMNYTPLHLVWAGQEAVVIFFVLSGFVLSLPFWKGYPISTPGFILKRIVRLYPTYIVVVVAAMVLMVGITARPTVIDDWLRPYWAQPLDWSLVRNHLLMLGEDRYNTVDAPVWSLAVEMQISLIFPFMIFAMRKLGWMAIPFALAFALMQRLWGLPMSLYYLWLFVLGAEMARRRDLIARTASRIGAPLQYAIVALALIGLLARWLLPVPSLALHLLVGLSAGAIVLACLDFPRLHRVLSHPLATWLGKISYSLYLVHFVVLLTMIDLLGDTLPLWGILVLMPFVSVGAADLLYRALEAPSIALSHAQLLPRKWTAATPASAPRA
jgi:peptidoglycan/LPS O-acetylase OafA/YrhL